MARHDELALALDRMVEKEEFGHGNLVTPTRGWMSDGSVARIATRHKNFKTAAAAQHLSETRAKTEKHLKEPVPDMSMDDPRLSRVLLRRSLIRILYQLVAEPQGLRAFR